MNIRIVKQICKYSEYADDSFNPIQDGEKTALHPPHTPPLDQFHPCNFYKRRNFDVPKTFDVQFYLFCHTSVKFQGHTWFQSQIIELEPSATLTNFFFSGQIFIKLLFCHDKFSHRNVRVTKLWSHDHIYDIV